MKTKRMDWILMMMTTTINIIIIHFSAIPKNKCIPSWKVENRHRKGKKYVKGEKKDDDRVCMAFFIFRMRETDKLTCCIIASACYWCCLCYSCTRKETGKKLYRQADVKWCMLFVDDSLLLSFSFCCRQCTASIFREGENCFKRCVAKQAEKCKQNLCHIWIEGKKESEVIWCIG